LLTSPGVVEFLLPFSVIALYAEQRRGYP